MCRMGHTKTKPNKNMMTSRVAAQLKLQEVVFVKNRREGCPKIPKFLAQQEGECES